MNQIDIRSMSLDELKSAFVSMSEPAFRADQVFEWLHKHRCKKFEEMSNLPLALRERLSEKFDIETIKIKKKLVSDIDGTVKYLYMLSDGNLIEAVVMKYHHGDSICISTQVGCKMGCAFCASTIAGFVRNLTASEMLSEIETAEENLNIQIDSIVLMGVGEPLDNYENTVKFLKILSDPKGRGMSLRHLSLSTSGLVDRIEQLMKEKLQLTLSVSLHASNDRLRDQLMPVNRRWNISELLSACRKYIEYTGRRISFEYILLGGVNDSERDARTLAHLLKGMICHVNLINANPVSETNYRASDQITVERFKNILIQSGINATVRRKMGADINAACGQLRRDTVFKGGNSSIESVGLDGHRPGQADQ